MVGNGYRTTFSAHALGLSLCDFLAVCTQSTKCYSWKSQGGVQWMGSSFPMVFNRWAHDASITFLSSSDETSRPKLICGARTLNPQKCSVPCWSGHRKYRKSPLAPDSLYISTVPPVVKEKKVNLPTLEKTGVIKTWDVEGKTLAQHPIHSASWDCWTTEPV